LAPISGREEDDMGEVRDRMKQDLRLKCYRAGTQALYLSYAKRFVAHFMKPPTELGREEVRKYQLYLHDERKLQPGTVKGHLGAIRFLYTFTLGKPEVVAGILWPRQLHKLPDVLACDEVEAVFANVESIEHRAILMATYGAGLRITEACRLCIPDLDPKRGLIHIRDGKRGRDRYVMLPVRLLGVLREYWRQARPPGPQLFPGTGRTGAITPRAVGDALAKAVAISSSRSHRNGPPGPGALHSGVMRQEVTNGVSYVQERDDAFWLAGTRVSLDSLVYAFWNGQTAESIAQSFPTLSLEQVYGAITFYLGHRDEIDRYLAKRRDDFDAARDGARTADPAFYAKLGALRRS
jgi:integrase/recombinase XerD